MPLNHRTRSPGPLDSLPRPLSERRRPGQRRRRFLGLLTVVLVVGAIMVAVSTIAGRPSPAAGAVAGIAATPESSVLVAPTPDPTAAVEPDPVATPAPSGTPVARGDTLSPADPGATAVPAVGPDPIPAAVAAPDPATLTGYEWPLPRGRLTLPFGPSPWGGWIVDGKNFHDGVDLATFCNDKIVAAHDGVVVAAGRHFDDELGWVGDLSRYYARLDKKHLWKTLPIVVVVDDGNGYRSVYAHFWKIKVKKGDTVKAGQLIGFEGMTGHASGCHLHYGLFSPLETARFATDKDVAKRMKLPKAEIARIDPLLVLPHRAKDPKPLVLAPTP